MRPEPPGTAPATGKHCRCCETARRREFDALSRNQRLVQALERQRERHPEDDGEIQEALRWP